MNKKIKSLLLLFYFGSIEDTDRTLVERELLTDPEFLVDYLDLKRGIEAAEVFPAAPSETLWLKLQEKAQPKKKFLLSLSFGAAAVAIIFTAILVIKPASIDQKPTKHEVLFDSRSELSSGSGVL